MRLIDADALLRSSRIGKVLYFDDTATDGYTDVLLAVEVERAPTIEVKPVRHGEWRTGNRAPVPIDRFVCSVCDGLVIVSTFRNRCMYNYCPNCGAKMDKQVKVPNEKS